MLPQIIPNLVDGKEISAIGGESFDKLRPADGTKLCNVARSRAADVDAAIKAAVKAQPTWGDTPAVKRGEFLLAIVQGMQARREEIAKLVAEETGKSLKDALGETGGAISLGLFYAGEGQRLYGRTTTSMAQNKYAMTVRQPIGVAGLIIAANTPIANVAWKVFPALICGNAAVLKAAEDTPATAWLFGKLAEAAGLPSGVLNIIQGFGEEAGSPLVADPRVGVVSFTGSTAVGKIIQRAAGERLARISLELGGKNPLVVCDDADLSNAVKWTLLSAYSNAGQRCAAASRIIVFASVYDKFKAMLLEGARNLKVGISDSDDFGAVINERQLKNMLSAVEKAQAEGATVLLGGNRLLGPSHDKGFFMAPTILENADPKAEISRKELFGPIATLYKVGGFDEALSLANDSPYGLTACIHTRNFSRAVRFADKVQSGVAVVNAGTYGSEPHMPFGGVKQSGNGSREPGTEALNVYSELKDIYLNVDPAQL
ncbi:MAG TPA: aldehyde dehydrogenase family protein [Fibrobacteria bacterium]|nr:aldehyde dehydrogenase family protein [Fibrobacteria bacterium]